MINKYIILLNRLAFLVLITSCIIFQPHYCLSIMKQQTILIATHNRAKFEEMRKKLSSLPYTFVSLHDVGINVEVEEHGATCIENAVLKATAYARLAGLMTIADDSGLEVDALNGEPGIYAARYAGPQATDDQKVAYLLAKMEHIPVGKRQARFFSAVVCATPDGAYKTYTGSFEGEISREPYGRLIKGFPYRRIFLVPSYGKTLSELDEQGISYSSHRDHALQNLITDLLNPRD